MHHLNLKTQLKKNSGPLNDTFDFIPLHLTFQGDVDELGGFMKKKRLVQLVPLNTSFQFLKCQENSIM